MNVRTSSGSKVNCMTRETGATTWICDLNIETKEVLQVVVSGARNAHQRFVVTYYKANSCTPYPLNLPITKEIASEATECVSFAVNTATNL